MVVKAENILWVKQGPGGCQFMNKSSKISCYTPFNGMCSIKVTFLKAAKGY